MRALVLLLSSPFLLPVGVLVASVLQCVVVRSAPIRSCAIRVAARIVAVVFCAVGSSCGAIVAAEVFVLFVRQWWRGRVVLLVR